MSVFRVRASRSSRPPRDPDRHRDRRHESCGRHRRWVRLGHSKQELRSSCQRTVATDVPTEPSRREARYREISRSAIGSISENKRAECAIARNTTERIALFGGASTDEPDRLLSLFWLRPSWSGVSRSSSLILRRKVVGWIPSSSAAALRFPSWRRSASEMWRASRDLQGHSRAHFHRRQTRTLEDLLRQVAEFDETAPAEHEGVLDDVLELPGVAGKVRPHEHVHDLARNARHVLVLDLVESRNEVLDEERDVLSAVAQRAAGRGERR